MTTITLGVGAEAVEVEDGSSVPMLGFRGSSIPEKSDLRGIVRLVDGIPCVVYGSHPTVIATLIPETGDLTQWHVKVDLSALRRECGLEPESMEGWSAASPDTNAVLVVGEQIHYEQITPWNYWTHRAGNTPEKQAAFDAALDALVDGPEITHDTVDPVIGAARALGYGKR